MDDLYRGYTGEDVDNEEDWEEIIPHAPQCLIKSKQHTIVALPLFTFCKGCGGQPALRKTK